MKKLILFASFILLIGCEKKEEHKLPLQPSLSATAPSVPARHAVGVIMGQSNALGVGMTDEFAPVEGVTTDMPRRGPGYALAANLVSKLGPIKLLTCAMGGSPMEQWSTYGDLYRGCITYLQSQMGPNDYLAFVAFDQGEAEAALGYSYPWAEHFTNSMRDLRSHYPDAPIIYVQLGAHTTAESDIPMWSYIQDQQASVMLPKCVMVPTLELGVVGEHYTKDGYAELGRRMAEAYAGIE